MKPIFTLLATFSLLASAHAAESSKPNLVFITADDLGWRDLGCFGSTFHRTPNLDKLAARGVKFTQAYAANPLCSPTRSSILTGLWPARTGITAPACHLPQVILEKGLAKGNPKTRVLVAESLTRLKTEYVTLPEVLREAGYRTGHFGKWHLGPEPYSPLQHGFDVDWPHWPGPGPAGSYVAPWKFPAALEVEGKPGEHIEDTLSGQVVKFIRENKDRPFFVNYWQFSVHAPYDAKDELVMKYRQLANPKNPQHNPVYAAMVESLDDGIGRVMAALEETGLLDKTIVVFFSDNGGVSWGGKDRDGAHKSARFQADMTSPPTSNLPLRNGKASLYEGGVREPCIVVWPGVTKPGTTNDTIIQSIDWMPTLLDMAGVPLPTTAKPDGVSLAPLLKGGKLERDTLFTHFPHDTPASGQKPGSSVRRGDWKLIRLFAGNDDGTDKLELYNLADDLGETRDLAAEKPDLVRELNALITGFLKDTGAVIPKLNPAFKAAPAAQPRETGWQTSKDAQLRIENGEMKITSTGRDPWMSTRELPAGAKGPFTLKLRLSSTASGNGVVYFSSKTQLGFHIAQTVSFPVQHDGTPHDYEVKLPVETLTALRLDPGNAPGDITLTTLELRDASGAVVKTWLTATADATGSSPRRNSVEPPKEPAAKGNAKSSIEPILRHRFADRAGFKSIGKVTTGLSLEGDEFAASLARGGDGKVARFDGGHLVREDTAVLLQGLSAFTLRLRLKPESDYLRGTLLVQRGASQPGSAAFDVSAWAMPFIEREHLAFQGMIEGGLGVGPGRSVPAVNVDQDRHPIPASGWRDVVITRTASGPLRLYLDGRLVAERSLASNVPGGSSWAFDGPRTPLVIGANADGGDAFHGWMDEVTLWNRALDHAELGALAGGQPLVNAFIKQPREGRIFGNGVLTAGTPVVQRYDWIDAKLPAFRDHLEKTDPHYPRYHLTLPGEQWNPIAFFHGGKYHVFFGWTTAGCFRYFEDTNENIVWQHIVSEDLITWEILPMPIRSPLYPNENGTFFLNDKGEVVTFYYGDRGDMPLMAVSRDPDLVKWEAFPDLVTFQGAPKEMKARHDPAAVFKRGDTWYQVSTTVRPQAQSMALPLYKSRDLTHWEYAGVFFEDATGRPINECGQLFQLDGRDVFTSIHDLSKNAQYMTGKVRADGTFERQHAGVADYTSLYYNCISTAVNDAGRATMWRFMNVVRPFREASAAGWWNTYGGPRDLRLDAQGRLLVRPSPALEKLRAKHVHRVIEPGTALKLITLDDFRAASSEVQLAFQAGTAGETGIRLTDGTKSLEARYDHRTREVQLDLAALSPRAQPAKGKENADTGGDGSRLSENRASIRRAPLPMKPGEPVTLRLFSDRSIFEIYANDELVISTAAFFHDPENLKARLFDRNGSKTKVTVDAWEMQPLKWAAKMKP